MAVFRRKCGLFLLGRVLLGGEGCGVKNRAKAEKTGGRPPVCRSSGAKRGLFSRGNSASAYSQSRAVRPMCHASWMIWATRLAERVAASMPQGRLSAWQPAKWIGPTGSSMCGQNCFERAQGEEADGSQL